MKQFEYRISTHPAEEFKQVAWFCNEDGSCDLGEVPADQMEKLSEILNDRGRDGWELVHLQFRGDGVMAFWKREIVKE